MKVWGVTKSELEFYLAVVSYEKYNNNLTFNRWPEQRGNALIFTLRVKDSKGPGHKRGLKFLGFDRGYALGKRLASACWHAHRDFMIELFHQFPNTRLKTSLADYHGETEFLYLYKETGRCNIGGSIFPIYLQDACDCCGPTLDEIIGLK